jgi:hypothetical protein
LKITRFAACVKKERVMKKAVLFAFNGDFMCFIHVLLNALDMQR